MTRKKYIVMIGSLLAVSGALVGIAYSRLDDTEPNPAADVRAQATGVTVEEMEIRWSRSSFSEFAKNPVSNVTDVLVDRDRRTLYATYYDETKRSFVAKSVDAGETWTVSALPEGVNNPRALRQLSDGSLLLGVSANGGAALLYRSDDGSEWEPIAVDANLGAVLPNRFSGSVWDLLELSDGTVLVATDELRNDPASENPTMYLLRGERLEALSSLPGLGVLSLVLGADGTVYAATEESAEHDDPSAAGQGRVFRSLDNGKTWEETGTLVGANRVYQLYVNQAGTIFAGTGILGEFYRSTDRGVTWERRAHVPATLMPRGERGTPTPVEASRVYSILELADGRMLVGTGNNAGDVFLTADEGETWEVVEDIGPNNVVWSLAQTGDGSVWVGTGSKVGDLFVARP